jgi:hypothetical protein
MQFGGGAACYLDERGHGACEQVSIVPVLVGGEGEVG